MSKLLTMKPYGELIVVTEGAIEQHFAIEVRDELGPVLKLRAVVGSTIFESSEARGMIGEGDLAIGCRHAWPSAIGGKHRA